VKKAENIFFGIFFGIILPLLFVQLAFLIWFFADKNESRVLYYLIPGIIPGLILNFFFLKSWVNKKFELPHWIMAAVFIFFNVEIFGMFMGFPVFTVIIAVLSGFYYGRRLQYESASAEKISETGRRVTLFTGAVMVVNCIASAYIALAGRGVGSEIQHMFHLGFEVTKLVLWAIIFVGGTILVLLQISLTWLTMMMILKNERIKKIFL
jgi:hypothetical protein